MGVLHLTGHATIADDCPYFLTETEIGEAYPASAYEIAEKKHTGISNGT